MKIKKQKTQKIVPEKSLKFKDYKKCLETAQIENKKLFSEKYEIVVDSLKEDHEN